MILAEADARLRGHGRGLKSHNDADLGSQLVAIADDPEGGDARMKVVTMYFNAVARARVGLGRPPSCP